MGELIDEIVKEYYQLACLSKYDNGKPIPKHDIVPAKYVFQNGSKVIYRSDVDITVDEDAGFARIYNKYYFTHGNSFDFEVTSMKGKLDFRITNKEMYKHIKGLPLEDFTCKLITVFGFSAISGDIVCGRKKNKITFTYEKYKNHYTDYVLYYSVAFSKKGVLSETISGVSVSIKFTRPHGRVYCKLTNIGRDEIKYGRTRKELERDLITRVYASPIWFLMSKKFKEKVLKKL